MKLERRSVFGWPGTAAGTAPCENGLVVHYDGSDQGLADKSHDKCRDYWRSVRKFHMGSRGWVDIGYCVDEETEILTTTGWKNFQEVAPGDLALTLNHRTGMSEWQPIEDVYVFPAAPREMIRMQGRQHSSLTTPNHRWPVERFYRRTGTERQKNEDGTWKATGKASRTVQGRERKWATTETLAYWDRIPIAAECADIPTEAKWSDALVEVIAWFWTEGHIKPQSRSREPSTSVAIYQKEGAGAARIRAALRSLFGEPVDAFPRLGGKTDGVPRWREARNRKLIEFHLSSDAGRVLLTHAPGRVVRHDFLLSLTRAQLDLFIHVSLLADGNNGRTVSWQQLAQKSKQMAESFQFAATLAGIATSFRRLASGMWCVHLRHNTYFTPRPAAASKTTFTITTERYDGQIWCVRTPNSTWLARRAGTVYFTGNSFGVCPHGYVLEGRGWQRQQAAQPGGNSTWTSVTFMSGDGERPTSEQVDAFKELRAWLRGEGLGAAIRGHRDFISTSCPGSILYGMVRDGSLTGSPQEDDMPSVKDVWLTDGIIESPPETAAGGNKYWTPGSYLVWGYRQDAETNAKVKSLEAKVQSLETKLDRVLDLLQEQQRQQA